MFDDLGNAFIIIGEIFLAGADSQVGDHVYAIGFVFDLDAGHSKAELVVGIGEAGKVVIVRPGEVIAIVEVSGAGNDQGRNRMMGGGIMGCLGGRALRFGDCGRRLNDGVPGLGGAGKRKYRFHNEKQENSKHLG